MCTKPLSGDCIMTRCLAQSLFTAVVWLGCVSRATDPAVVGQAKGKPITRHEAEAAVEAYLKKLEGPLYRHEPLTYKHERVLMRIFPQQVFIAARYDQFPVPRGFPVGLYASNLFAVDKDGTVIVLTTADAFERYFKANAIVRSGEDARAALAAWLLLAEEIHQDRYYKFEVLEKEFAIEGNGRRRTIRGRAMVTAGGNGEIRAKLVLEDGKLVSGENDARLIRGMRPICQATKLLDPDPIVRKMAEQNLLFMGVAARAYLMDQRAKACPELRDAIDRLWRRIRMEGW